MEVLTKYSHPPPELVKGSEKVVKNLIEAFNVKKGSPPAPPQSSKRKVPPKKLAKRKRVDDIKPVSGLDIEAILAKGASSSENKRPRLEGKIGSEDPAKDFKTLIENEENSWKNGPSSTPPRFLCRN
jgi:hypothetical protein